ncbi:MAG TPA: lytic murein transglycosylase [Actinomycetota bacterium]|nr:lytic murein transglycosylase [Actinomycetota bacterium]
MCTSVTLPVAPSHNQGPAARIAALIAGALVLAGIAVPIKSGRPPAPPAPKTAAADVRSADVEILSLERASKDPVYVGTDGERITAERIRAFLVRQRSPMADYARVIVSSGIRYGVDPRVIVAISGVESTYGRYSNGYNAWGWNSGKARWPSWSVAIERFTKALGSAYRSLRHGRFAAASRTYCPPCGARWGRQALAIFNHI